MNDMKEKEKINAIEKRLTQINDILLGARKKVINDFKKNGYISDSFIDKYLGKNKKSANSETLLLPYLYAFEIVMAPIGYLSAVYKEIAHPLLKSFLFEEIFKDTNFKNNCTKLFSEIWSCDGFGLFLEECNYSAFKPLPYGNFWNYDAMAWCFGFAVDALDFLSEINDTVRYGELIYFLEGFTRRFFSPENIEIRLGEQGNSTISGYYFSRQKISSLKRNIARSNINDSKLISDFKDNIHPRLAFAFSNRAVLAAYDIAEETINGIPNLKPLYDSAGKALNKLIDYIVSEIKKYNILKNEEDVRELYYHISNFGIFTSILGFKGYPSDFIELKEYWKSIIDAFLKQIHDDSEIKKPVDIFIPQEIPIEAGIIKEDVKKVEYTLNVAFPVFIRSMANMFGKAKEAKIDSIVNEFEQPFENAIDLFLEKYLREEDNIFVLPDEEGELQFDLALTASAVEALNLCMGYYLKRWKDLGGGLTDFSENRNNFLVPLEEYENYKAWETFKEGLKKIFSESEVNVANEQFDRKLEQKIEEIVTEKLNDTKVVIPQRNVRLNALYSFLDIFGDSNILTPNDKKEKNLQLLWQFFQECTLAEDEISDDKEKLLDLLDLKKKAIRQYFSPPTDSEFEPRCKDYRNELNNIQSLWSFHLKCDQARKHMTSNAKIEALKKLQEKVAKLYSDEPAALKFKEHLKKFENELAQIKK